jgi:hypothetical protein
MERRVGAPEVAEGRDEDAKKTRGSRLSRGRLAHVVLGAEPENERRQRHQNSGDRKSPTITRKTRLLHLPQQPVEEPRVRCQLRGGF